MPERWQSPASLKDVAALAGVSSTTASLILNGKVNGFSGTTVDRVRSAALDLSYRPNAVAQSLRRQRTHTIGLISHEIATTPFAGATIRGAQQAAWEAEYVLMLIDTEGDEDFEGVAIDALMERQIDGVLYARMKHEIIDVPEGLARVPTVLVDARTEATEFASVYPDDVGGAHNAVHHLIEAGHTRIAYLQSKDDVPAASERLAGYRSALEDAGLPVDPSLVLADPSEGELPQAAFELLDRSDRPTAIFCFNDRTAFGVYNAAARLGLSIPEDLSVVGFDNMETVAKRLDPPLTTMQLPYYEMGRWAVQALVQLMREPEATSTQIRMPCPLVERNSVAPPKETSVGVRPD